ncbi:MAG: universal stress protein [Bacteroidales bacterium]|jgi:nucleotide-binding universal stress UspA family protein|nr:universal stress protein [Bacteroidales bacterium]
MKIIIVPLDFSPESLQGLDLAIVYANAFKANLQLVHVIKNYDSATKRKSKTEWAMEKLEDILRNYRDKLFQDCEFSYKVREGKISDGVVGQAEAFDDSMVICSTHGESGFTNLFMGSNAYRIIQATRRPVLSITADKFNNDVKTIVMPIDITKETREKVPLVAHIAKTFGATVHIVKVTSSTNEGIHNKLRLYSRQVRHYFDEQGVKWEKSLLVGDNITDITIDYAETVEADLIAIMTEQTSTLANMLLGSYAQQMLHSSPIPVLSVTPKGLYHTFGFDAAG